MPTQWQASHNCGGHPGVNRGPNMTAPTAHAVGMPGSKIAQSPSRPVAQSPSRPVAQSPTHYRVAESPSRRAAEPHYLNKSPPPLVANAGINAMTPLKIRACCGSIRATTSAGNCER
jgi:hypothetical protein